MTIDFNDDTSILHNIALYTDPKSNASFSDIKTKASDSIKSKDAQIEALQSYIRYADEDLAQIRRDREAELEEKKTYKGQGLLSKAKRFFKGLGKGLSSRKCEAQSSSQPTPQVPLCAIMPAHIKLARAP